MVINKFMKGGLGMVIAVIKEIWDWERCDAVVIIVCMYAGMYAGGWDSILAGGWGFPYRERLW